MIEQRLVDERVKMRRRESVCVGEISLVDLLGRKLAGNIFRLAGVAASELEVQRHRA